MESLSGMPTDIMDQRLGPSLCLQPAPASLFSQEVGFWKLENVADHSGREGVSLMSGSKSFSSPPVEKIRTPAERSAGLSMNSWRVDGLGYGFRPDLFTQPASVFADANNGGLNDLLSNSLSNMFEKELKLSANDVSLGHSVDTVNSNLKQDEPFLSLEEIQAHAIRNLPSNVDDLLDGVADGLAYGVQPNHGDDTEDIFSSGGGMELEEDANFSRMNFYNSTGETGSSGHHGTLNNRFASQHPYGAHPSRTLFVRNITSDVEDTELKALFEQFGDIQTLYTACKHRGFVIISYYDIRAATNAISALQTKSLRHQRLDIQFSIPKDNPLEKGINEGTLVVFDLDSSISNVDIHHIFGVYGGIKEVRGTPHEHNHKFIEFYDVRAAEAALRALNMTEIAGKRIKLERARQCLMEHLPRELELEEFSGYWHGSPSNNSTTGFYGSDRLVMETAFQGTSSGVPHCLSSPLFVGPLDIHSVPSCHGELSRSLGQMNFGCQCMTDSPPHSIPGYHDGMQHGFGSPSNHSVEHNESAFGFSGDGSFPLNVPQHMWNNSGAYHHNLPGSVMWPNSPTSANNIPLQLHGFLGALPHMLPSPHHHVSSAPAINPSLWDRRRAHPRNADVHTFHPGSLGRAGLTSRNTFPRAWGSHVDFALNGTPPRHRARMSQGRNYVGPASDAPNDRITNRISDSSANQAGDKKQFELIIERIFHGEDSRTTIMIKNIPNKYSAKLLLATIDEYNKGTYDFFYLPIDFKNKCNVGYAFINMINPRQIIPIYQAFNGKKWEKFNSEKVALLTYARIQGKENLIAHFQNSSLMNEDKGYRPLLFHTCGPNAGDQEPFPMGSSIRSRPCKQRSGGYRENHWGSLSMSPSEEGMANGAGSSSAYFKRTQ